MKHRTPLLSSTVKIWPLLTTQWLFRKVWKLNLLLPIVFGLLITSLVSTLNKTPSAIYCSSQASVRVLLIPPISSMVEGEIAAMSGLIRPLNPSISNAAHYGASFLKSSCSKELRQTPTSISLCSRLRP